MKYWPKIFSALVLISLLLNFKTATFRITMPENLQTGIRQGLLETGVATEETIDTELQHAELRYKQSLTGLEKMGIYTQSATWWLLMISVVAVLFSKTWGYYLTYISTLLNLYTSFCYLPLISSVILPWLVNPAGIILIQIINALMIAAVFYSQLEINKNPNQGMDPTESGS